MEAEIINMGVISIIPALIAIVLSFATRNTIVSLVVACIVGTLLSGQGLLGFPTLLKTSLGTTSFSWVMPCFIRSSRIRRPNSTASLSIRFAPCFDSRQSF